MIIAIVDFQVSPPDQAMALEILASDGVAATAIPGNLGFRAFTDAGSPTHVGLMHEWTDAAAFEAYLASAGFAEVGAKLRPMMTGAPVSRRFDAVLYETVR
jgi:quinol monooxygenase YgiN